MRESFPEEKPREVGGEGAKEVQEINIRKFIKDASEHIFSIATEYLEEYMAAAPPEEKKDLEEAQAFLRRIGPEGLELAAIKDLESSDKISAISLLVLLRGEMLIEPFDSGMGGKYRQKQESMDSLKSFNEQISSTIDDLVGQSSLFSDMAVSPEEQGREWAENLKKNLEIIGRRQVLSSGRIDKYLNAEKIADGTASAEDLGHLRDYLIGELEIDLPVASTSFIEYLAGKFTKNDLIREVKGLAPKIDMVSGINNNLGAA